MVVMKWLKQMWLQDDMPPSRDACVKAAIYTIILHGTRKRLLYQILYPMLHGGTSIFLSFIQIVLFLRDWCLRPCLGYHYEMISCSTMMCYTMGHMSADVATLFLHDATAIMMICQWWMLLYYYVLLWLSYISTTYDYGWWCYTFLLLCMM